MNDKMKTRWVIDGYTSANHASNAANRRGETGVTGPGQVCCAMDMSYYEGCRGWIFKTWDGRFLVPGGEVPNETMAKFGGKMNL